MASVYDFVYHDRPKIPTTQALILTGLQNDFCSPGGKLYANVDAPFIQRLEEVVLSFRDHGSVIWVRSEFDRALPTDQHGTDGYSTIVFPAVKTEDHQAPIRPGQEHARDDDDDDKEAQPEKTDKSSAESIETVDGQPIAVDEELFLDVNARGGPATVKDAFGSMYFDKIKHLMRPEDHHVIKHNYSAFESTGLLHSLRSKIVSHVFICGALSNVSAYATALDAARNGIEVTFVEDCLAYRYPDRHDLAMRTTKRNFVAKLRTSQQVVDALQNPHSSETDDDEYDDGDEEYEFQDGGSDVAEHEHEVLSGYGTDQQYNVDSDIQTESQVGIEVCTTRTASRVNDDRSPLHADLDSQCPRPEDLEVDSDTEEDETPLQVTLPMRALSKRALYISATQPRKLQSRDVATSSSQKRTQASEVPRSVNIRTSTNSSNSITLAANETSPLPESKILQRPVYAGSRSDIHSSLALPDTSALSETGVGQSVVTLKQPDDGLIQAHSTSTRTATLASDRQNDEESDRLPQHEAQASLKPHDSDRQLKTKQSWQSLFHADDNQRSLISSERLLLAEIEGVIPGFRSRMHKPSSELTEQNCAHQKQPLFNPEDLQASAGSSIVYNLLDEQAAAGIFDDLKAEVQWVRMLHQTGEVPRLVCCQGTFNQDGSMPVYRHPADKTILITPWTRQVDEIRKVAERVVGHELNHALIQLYRTGHDFISEHSDKTLDIVPGSNIVNVSFGAERTMRLRTKRGSTAERTTHRIPMPHNSMLIMSLATNAEYLHGIKADKRREAELSEAESAYSGQRISLTFRQIGTFLTADDTIWGQGAIAKTDHHARPVINGDEVESKRLIDAFGRENQSSVLDWETFYGRGSDVLHVR